MAQAAIRRPLSAAIVTSGALIALAAAGCHRKAGIGDGMPDPATVECALCHGDSGNGNAAPPSDLKGRTDTSLVEIGAHQQHLADSAIRKAVACSECHVVPEQFDAANHNVGGPAQVIFGELATHAGTLAPTWDRTTHTCSDAYCHGQTLTGGTLTKPDWIVLDGTQAACGTCHGTPPSPPHAQSAACWRCHPETVKADGTIDVEGGKHIDGVLEVITLTCTSCHGDGGRVAVAGADPLVAVAPPTDTQGNTDSSHLTVGAHQTHVNPGAGALSSPLACADCHVVPTETTHSNGTVDLLFSGLATTGGVVPAFNGTGCADTYCHGNFAGGNASNTPTWTAGAEAIACGTCHGNGSSPRPGGTHPANDNCAMCHAGYTSSSVATALHVNGVVDVSLGCTSCHGTPGVNAAPPVDTQGSSVSAAVGAHQTHLLGGAVSNGFACTTCHPDNSGNLLHSNGTTNVVFSAGLSNQGTTTTWASGGCATSYCHGTFSNGNGANTPSWAGGAAEGQCGTCHGTIVGNNPLPGGTHPALGAWTCGDCHDGYTSASANKTLHVNGRVDLTCVGCHTTIANGMTGVTTVSSSHSLGGGATNFDAGGDWSGATLRASTNYGTATCVSMCHPIHNHTPTLATNVYDSATTRPSAAANTDFASVGGGLCLTCHTRPVDAGRPALTLAAYDAAAHNYTSNAQGTWTYALSDASLFARNCTKCHAAASEAAPTIGAGGGSRTAVHFSTTSSTLLAGTTNPNGTPGSYICYNCHGNGATGTDRSGKNIATLIAKTGSAHPVNTDNVHDSAAEFAGATFGNGLGGAGRHVNCLDCHNPHEAQAKSAALVTTYSTGTATISATVTLCPVSLVTPAANRCYTITGAGGANWTTTAPNMVGWRFKLNAQAVWYPVLAVNSATQLLVYSATAPTAGSGAYEVREVYRATNVAGEGLRGAFGVAFGNALAPWTAPTAANFTKVERLGATDLEASVCLKCHSSYFGTLPTSPSGGYTETDVAMEFNPGNVSFHPVFASASGNPGATGAILPPFSRTSLMSCSDCHESEAITDLGGPHGSAAKFLLKGPNTTWDATVTLVSYGGGDNEGMPAGTFCANCHPARFDGSRFPRHNRSNHDGVPCFNCHQAIPHGGMRPGLLIAAAGAAVAVPAQTSFDTAPPYNQVPAAVDQLYLKSYPATNTTAWAQNNCGCNGTGH